MKESPADGQALKRELCRDSYVNDVSTHHNVELRRIELLTFSLRTKRSTN